MTRSSAILLGYHGCGRELGMQVVTGEAQLVAQNRPYHWLGDGIYFWENDPDRAQEWAEEKASRGELVDPFVIGAILDLGRCLDLHVRENQKLLSEAYDNLATLRTRGGFSEMPKNKKAPRDQRDDKVLRFLDCAVINHLQTMVKEPFDSVRGLFVEGDSIYPGGEIFHKTRSEIAVRNTDCIKGYFLPLQRAP